MFIGWLEYEVTRDRVCEEDTRMQGDLWYRNRLQWIVELMDVFELSLPRIRGTIPWKAILTELERDQQENMRKALEEHFTLSIRSIRACTR